MDIVFEQLIWAREYYADMIKSATRELRRLPQGRLYRKNRNGKDVFYCYYNRKQSLIKKSEKGLIRLLARRYYVEENLYIYKSNYTAISICLENYCEWNTGIALEDIPNGYTTLPKELFFSQSGERKEQIDYRNEDLLHLTTTGERIRSKSEIIGIAILEKYHIPYEYESEVWFDGQRYLIDFKLIRPRDNKEIYYEHFGRMDKRDYREKTAGKIVTYAEHGLVLWDNFIITFDNEKGGIDVGQIERIFKAFVL